MHRMVAEFLAADNLVSGMVDPPDNDAFRFIVQAAIGLARRERFRVEPKEVYLATDRSSSNKNNDGACEN